MVNHKRYEGGKPHLAPAPGSFFKMMISDAESNNSFENVYGRKIPHKIVTARAVSGDVCNGIMDPGRTPPSSMMVESPRVYFDKEMGFFEKINTEAIYDTSGIVSDFWDPSESEIEAFMNVRGDIHLGHLGDGETMVFGANIDEVRVNAVEIANGPQKKLNRFSQTPKTNLTFRVQNSGDDFRLKLYQTS